MPVYTIASLEKLTPEQTYKVSEAITDIHCDLTGAPTEFVNVIFMNGQSLANNKKVGVIGNVRSGGNRNRELTDELKYRIHEGVAEVLALSIEQLSMALVGVPASWGMEGGEILPEPGEEEAWLRRTKAS